jgi:hypothetical protein
LAAVSRTRSRKVPFFAEAIMDRVAQRRDTEGIYRKSGLQTNIDLIQEHIERTVDLQTLTTFLDTQAPHDLACAMKLYIRTLAVPIVPEITAEFKETLAMLNLRHSLQYLKVLVTVLPTPHYALLRAICEHLEVVVGGNNQMNYVNLALVLGSKFSEHCPRDISVMEVRSDSALQSLSIGNCGFPHKDMEIVIRQGLFLNRRFRFLDINHSCRMDPIGVPRCSPQSGAPDIFCAHFCQSVTAHIFDSIFSIAPIYYME